MRSALILVENDTVPADTRVWAECLSLRRAGWDVTVISPQGSSRDSEAFSSLEGVRIHRFDPFRSTSSAGYVREYGRALLRMSALVRRLSRTRRFDVVHACNPPDFLLLAAVALRRRGAATIFDHHDLSPELYLAKYGRGGAALRALKVAERLGFVLADVVLATNESFRAVAIERGRKAAGDVFVVRNGPDTTIFRPTEPERDVRAGAKHVIGYVGVIESQDGVDVALEALAALRTRRDDWHAVFVGDGGALADAQALSRRRGLDDVVTFAGYVTDVGRLVRMIAACDVCISPEPRNRLNEHTTFTKVAEYMAVGRPVVAFDLAETRRTAGEAAVYAERDDPVAFADAIDELLDDAPRRERLGALGRERATTVLSWRASEEKLLAAYAHALERAGRRRRRRGSEESATHRTSSRDP
jgi:glycosyltransferase involved in cell wall biosynthesis